MAQVVELRILIQTTDDRENAADRIEAQVRKSLHREWDAALCYVDRVTATAPRQG